MSVPFYPLDSPLTIWKSHQTLAIELINLTPEWADMAFRPSPITLHHHKIAFGTLLPLFSFGLDFPFDFGFFFLILLFIILFVMPFMIFLIGY